MPTTLVVGGQYGSEGKGKVVANIAASKIDPWVVRCGGPNSGHTATLHGNKFVFRQLPTAADIPRAHLLLSAGCVVDADVLLDEVAAIGSADRVVVDPRVVVVNETDRQSERDKLTQIGSTCSGTGAALARRALRYNVELIGSCKRLRQHLRIEPVAPLLHRELDAGADVIIEGTQGFGLSLLHGPHYPFVTSRDTTASGFTMEVGLSPRQINAIIMVVRTFPIRVGGTSGPLPEEIDWEEVARFSGAPQAVPEFTSVTNKLRRVARFDPELVRIAAMYNRPTDIALMGIDRLDHQNYGATKYEDLTDRALSFIAEIERLTNCPVTLVGSGFDTFEILSVPHRDGVLRG